MGYYTYYNLEIINTCSLDLDEDIIGKLRESNEDAAYAFNGTGKSDGWSTKWYDALEDMQRFSSLHPGILFKMTGEGEESGDLWAAYFKNGEMQYEKAVITYGECKLG